MIFNVFNKAKNIIFDKSNSGLTATNVQDAITEVNSRNLKISIPKQSTTYIEVKESCLIIWSQNSNCGGVIVVDNAINYINKIVKQNESAGELGVTVSNGVVTLTNNLGGSVQCYILTYNIDDNGVG